MPPHVPFAGRSAPSPGAQGTMGGAAPASPPPGKRAVILGDEIYLWILIAVELGVISYLRATFSRYHGG